MKPTEPPSAVQLRSVAADIDVTQLIGALRRQAVARSRGLDFMIAYNPASRRTDRHRRKAPDGGLAPFDVDIRVLLRLDGPEFVRKAYLKLLGRRPDPAGAAFFLSRLHGSWADKVGVLQALRYSDEGRARGVRVPGLRLAIFLRNYFSKPDLFLRDLMRHDGSDFIHNAYRQVLGRPADAGGYISQLVQLERGWVGKIRVLANFRYSPEGRARNIRIGGLGIAIAGKNLYLAFVYLPRRAGGMILRWVWPRGRRRARRADLASISEESSKN